MSLQNKKLELIESILKVEEESVLYEVTAVIKKAERKNKGESLSDEDLIELLNASEKDYKNGKSIKQSELKKQVKTWAKK